MSERVLYEWSNGRFCYRVLGGSMPRVERGGASGSVRVFSGVTVCNDAATVNELARLAARVAELEAANAKLRRYFEIAEEIRVTVANTLAFRLDDLDAARAEVDK